MSNDEKKFQPIFQILHIKSAWFLLELAMALVTTIGMRFLQVCQENVPNVLNWQCSLAGSSKMGPQDFIFFSIAMDAKPSF